MAMPLDLPLLLPLSNSAFLDSRAAAIRQRGPWMPDTVVGGKQGAALDGGFVCHSSPPAKLGGEARTASSAQNYALEGLPKKEREELLWQEYFSDPAQWWDNRLDKRSPRHPDFKHKTSKEGLWLHSRRKPAWVDSQLGSPAGVASTSGAGNGGGVGEEGDSVLETLSKRCEEGKVREAVEELEILGQRGCHVGDVLFRRVLRMCVEEGDLKLGRRVHALVRAAGLQGNASLANHIIGMYSSHGQLEEALQAFGKVSAPDAYTWSSIILAHARNGQPKEAIRFYRQMRETKVKPDNHIFVAVLKACAGAEDLVSGKLVHEDIAKSAVRINIFVGNSLVNMYSKCGSLEDARRVFDSLGTKDVVTWTAMISGYTQKGLGREALALYGSMQKEGVSTANKVTFVSLLRACASVGDLKQGKQLHAQVRQGGMEGDAVVGNCLVDMYAKCGSLEDARAVFDKLLTRDVVTWTAMISGYAQQGMGQQALLLYKSMQQEGVSVPDAVTFTCLLQACASVGALQTGKDLHSQIRNRGLEAEGSIGSSLVNMYAKCGSLEEARSVFDTLPTKDVVAWNALLKGYAEDSNASMAIQCFKDMCEQGFEPNETTFSSILVACSHAGLVDEGQRYFKMMEEHKIAPSAYHHNCMVDLLGRAGRLDEAEHILQTAPYESNVVGWRALLTACKNHDDAERGRRCFDRIVQLEPQSASPYVLLGNIYANAGRWKDVDEIESLRKSAGAWKKPAKACIEVEKTVHEFTVGEDRADISSKLKSVNSRLKDEGGHVPKTELVLRAGSEQEKEDSLCGHAEKLALAYGLLNTPNGTPLLVTKNLRMCNDCHSSTKIMSRLEEREIIVRDAHRVHRFQNGSCSCGDRH